LRSRNCRHARVYKKVRKKIQTKRINYFRAGVKRVSTRIHDINSSETVVCVCDSTGHCITGDYWVLTALRTNLHAVVIVSVYIIPARLVIFAVGLGLARSARDCFAEGPSRSKSLWRPSPADGNAIPLVIIRLQLYTTRIFKSRFWRPSYTDLILRNRLWHNHKEESLSEYRINSCLAKNYPTFRGTRRFITVLTNAQCPSLSQPDKLQFSASHQNFLKIFYIFCHFLVDNSLKTDPLFSKKLIFRLYWLFILKNLVSICISLSRCKEYVKFWWPV
jgi:hypothetical protein